jgi:YggT family protein
MGSSYLADPVVFLIDTIFSLYILAVALRFLLQWSYADFYNPVSQVLVKLTHPPLKVLRRFVPSVGKIDTSALLLIMILQMTSDFTILALKGVMVGLPALMIISLTQILNLFINIFIFTIFARAILSWIAVGHYNAASSILYSLSEPVLSLCRRLTPDLGGLDLSPLVALIMLQLMKMILLPPLHQLASLLG